LSHKAQPIIIIALTVIASAICVLKPNLVATPSQAKPAFMDRYDRDAYARRELVGKCTVCHVGRGGAERNDFGEAFEDAAYRITPRLRKKFPALFGRETP
jgi:hypothetical protein